MDAWVATFTAVTIALIAAAKEIIVLWIRARHRWKNGHDAAPVPPAAPPP